MKITTKYNIADKVWVMYKDQVIEGQIRNIDVGIYRKEAFTEKTDPQVKIDYSVFSNKISEGGPDNYMKWYQFPEEKIFKTKEDLLRSL